MNLLFLLSPFARLLSGWFSRSEATAPLLDVSQARALKLKGAMSVDPRVQVPGPSTVVVFQSNRARILIDWPRQDRGEVSVPLRSVDDGSGPLYVWVITEHDLRERVARSLSFLCPVCLGGAPGGEMEHCCGEN